MSADEETFRVEVDESGFVSLTGGGIFAPLGGMEQLRQLALVIGQAVAHQERKPASGIYATCEGDAAAYDATRDMWWHLEIQNSGTPGPPPGERIWEGDVQG